MADLIHNLLPKNPRKTIFIKPTDTVRQCIDLMIEKGIGALVVAEEADKIIGIVSERDIVFSSLQQWFDIKTTKVSEIVYTAYTVLSPDDSVESAMQAMTDTRRRHILVSDKGKFIAVLSIGDLLYHLLEDKARVIEHLENYIHN